MISQGDYNRNESPGGDVGCRPKQNMDTVSNKILGLPTERTPFSVFNVKMTGDSNTQSGNIQSNVPLFYTNLDIRFNKNYFETTKVHQSQPNMHESSSFSTRHCYPENKNSNEVVNTSNAVSFNNHAYKPFISNSDILYTPKESSCRSFLNRSQTPEEFPYPYLISRPQILTEGTFRSSLCKPNTSTDMSYSHPVPKPQTLTENPYTSFMMSRSLIPRDIPYTKQANTSHVPSESCLSSHINKPLAQTESPCSNTLSMSRSDSSMLGESTLGTTLAQSLKLISTSNLPLAHSPVRTPSPKTRAVLLHPQTPVVALKTPDREEPNTDKTFLDLSPVNISRRYKTRSSSDKKIPSSKRKESVLQDDADEERPTSADSGPSKDNSVTLFQCEECFKMFNRKQTLRQHFITHTDRFPCPYCKVRCKSKGDLRTHIQTHTKEKPYHCEVCNTNYTRESILKKHQTTQTHKKAVAAMGNKTHKSSTDPTARQEPVFSEVKFEGVACNKCGKAFLTWAELRKHKKLHFLKFKCKWCNKRCRTSTLLKFHMKHHVNKNSLTCKLCCRSFPNHFLMKEHIRSHAKMKTEMTKEVSWKSLIERNYIQGVSPHESQQKGKQSGKRQQRAAKWSCRMCSKVYINKKSLENHEKVHHCHCCSVCDKRFPTLSKLKMHMKHHGKPYTCELCESPFFDQAEFKNHVDKYHNRDDDLKCKICYEEFNSAADLQFHMQNHAPTMLFSGACLDESSIPVHKSKKAGGAGSGAVKVSDSESSSENEDNEDDTAKRPLKADGGDLRKVLNSNRFLELLSNRIIDLSNPEGRYDDSDSDDELVLAVKTIALQSDLLDRPDVCETGEYHDQVKECQVYSRDQIMEKHGETFSLNSELNYEQGIFTCTICNSSLPQKYLLQQHFLEHVCDYCNTFFHKKESIQYHKEEHRKELMAKMKYEAEKMRLGWRDIVSSESSDSGGEDDDDGFLSELENVLDCKISSRIAVNSLQTLSHDEIVIANKKTFERYSCIDAASSIFACTICKRKYARPTTLTRHFKTHVCPYCNQFFEDKADLLEHKYKHRKEAMANSSDLSTSKKKMPSSPMVTKVNRELFKKFSFIDSARNLNRCTLCCKNFVRRTVLTRHMKTHICSHCDKFYEDKYDLAKHVNTIRSDLYFSDGDQDEFDYEDEDEQPFSGVGDRTKLVSIPSAFPNGLTHFSPAFNAPMTGDNPALAFIQIPASEGGGESAASQMYTTTPGGSTFQIISEPDTNPESFLVAPTNGAGVDPSKLITIPQSQIVPDDNDDRQRLYECEECGKRFYKSTHLKSHMLIHAGEKPYACRLCGKSFSRSSTLRKHEKTHLKRCKICDSTFSYKYELDMHMEIHRTYAFYK